MDNSRQSSRLPGLDLIRFFAAFAVLAYHYVSSYPPIGTSGPILDAVTRVTRYGYLGVELFFMISGFVILWSAQGKSPTQFAISRFSRLYPTFWVAMLLTAAALSVLPEIVSGLPPNEITLKQVAVNATMIPGMLGVPRIDEVYWTLEVELRFYFLVFLAALFRQSRNIERLVIFWLAICTLGSFVALPRFIGFFALMPYGPFFIAGCVIYLAYSRGWNIVRLGALLLSAVLCLKTSLRVRGEFITPDTISGQVVPLIVTAFLFLLVLIVSWPRLVPDTRLVRRLGALTYPLYLTHAAIGRMLIEHFSPRIGAGAAVLGASAFALVLAWLLTVLVDEPARRPVNRLCHKGLEVFRGALHKRRTINPS